MSEVRIYEDDENRWRCEVNGADLAPIIKDGVCSVEFPPGGGPAVVYMALIPRRLWMGLPDATVNVANEIAPPEGRQVTVNLKVPDEASSRAIGEAIAKAVKATRDRF